MIGAKASKVEYRPVYVSRLNEMRIEDYYCHTDNAVLDSLNSSRARNGLSADGKKPRTKPVWVYFVVRDVSTDWRP